MAKRVQTNFTAGGASEGGSKPAPKVEAVPHGTVKEVLDWVGDDAEKAQRALDEENKSSDPRATVVAGLEKVIAASGE